MYNKKRRGRTADHSSFKEFRRSFVSEVLIVGTSYFSFTESGVGEDKVGVSRKVGVSEREGDSGRLGYSGCRMFGEVRRYRKKNNKREENGHTTCV